MNVLVVGSGGREHALAWSLARNNSVKVYAFPGNPGIAQVAQCLPGTDFTPKSILAAAESSHADFTVIGPEVPLVAGVVDLFRAAGRLIVGPTAECARLEGSKVFAKQFFADHQIPTATFVSVDNTEEGLRALSRFSFPVVIKADGLAGGKGVIIAQNKQDAEAAVQQLGPSLVIEEFLQGPELSFIVLSDGNNVVSLLPSRDHKKVLEGEQGPNTGGMGAFCDAGLLTESTSQEILSRIILPTVAATGFTGFLYAGLILTPQGPKILEFNVRLGDPETQAILFHLKTDLAGLLHSAATGKLDRVTLDWKDGASLCVVLTAEGYPGSVTTGDPISGIAEAEKGGATVFHAGTRMEGERCVTGGGRVLGVTASGNNVKDAAKQAYQAASQIHFRGMHYRRDIGSTYDGPEGT